jgi:ERCC4-related helicase
MRVLRRGYLVQSTNVILLQRHYSHSTPQTITNDLKKARLKGDYNTAVAIYETYKATGKIVDIYTHTTMISVYTSLNNLQNALAEFSKIENPNTIAFKSFQCCTDVLHETGH